MDQNQKEHRFKCPNDYLSFYGIDQCTLSVYKQLKLEGKTMVQIFEPTSIKNTVLLIHGYFDHTGSLKNVINHFLSLNYRIVSYDLEGHGLSSGNRGEIQDFADYVESLKEVLAFCKKSDFYPSTVIAHSTGAAIFTDYLLQYRKHFEKVIYFAPLVRPANWQYVLTASKVVPIFKQKLTRKFVKNSGDVDYLAFVKHDPLQCRFISISWVLAMIRWNKKLEEYPPSTQDIYIIQGSLDETVDWKYNVTYLRKKFPFAQIALVTDGGHQIINDSPVIMKQVFALIDKYRLS
jgi:alpha-beta hydrolase superfamily lysophospholipase